MTISAQQHFMSWLTVETCRFFLGATAGVLIYGYTDIITGAWRRRRQPPNLGK